MRPLRVRMQGFGPFREPTEVDFSDVELVALVGTTGSGKSTILDAITFALFGQIARLDARAVAPVINALSAEARVGFDFELGGKAYTALRVVRRTATGASTKEARLERGDESLAATGDEVKEAVEQLLGMNFERFTKVAFLPQGRFADFLHDRPADRQKLLRELLGLGVYTRIGQRAREIAAGARSQLDVLRPKLSEAGVTDEQIAELDRAAERLDAAHHDLRRRLAARIELVRTVQEAEAEAHDYGVLAVAVSQVAVPAAVAEIGRRIDAAAAALGVAEAARGEAAAAHDAARSARAEGPDAGQLERWRAGRDELESLHADIVDLQAASLAAERDHVEAEDAHRRLEQELDDARVAAEAAATTLAATEQALAGCRSAESIEQDRRAHARLAELTDRIAQATRPDGEAAITEAAERQATDAEERARDTRRAAAAALRDAERTGHVAVLAGPLRAGDECPVCLQVVSTVPEHEPALEIAAAEAALERAEAAMQDAQQRRARAAQAATEARSRLEHLHALCDEAAAEVAQLDSLADLEIQAQQRAERVSEVAAARDRAAQAAATERALRDSDRAASVRRALAATAGAASSAQAALDAALSRADRLEDALRDAPDRETIDAGIALVAELEAEVRRAEAAYRAAEAAAAAARSAREQVEQSEDRLRRDFGAARDRFVGVGPPQPEHRSLLEDWTAFARWAHELLAPLEARHRDASERAGRAATELVSADAETTDFVTGELAGVGLAAALGGHDDRDPVTAVRDVPGLEPMVNRLAADARAEAISARKLRDQMARMRDQVAELEDSLQVHELLGVQLRSSGFEQWLLDEVVQGLVERAGERLFELSAGQYSIEANDMVFAVRDHRNGDELRDARTLSGGETFLASLALALALADSLAELTGLDTPPVECLFLDEGFGTLDPETLDVVAGAIEELGASGRMVGVITHIRELAERMPVRFEVTKLPTTSIVTKVVS